MACTLLRTSCLPELRRETKRPQRREGDQGFASEKRMKTIMTDRQRIEESWRSGSPARGLRYTSGSHASRLEGDGGPFPVVL